jgi:uncharacterized RDD family membrane protein YckC
MLPPVDFPLRPPPLASRLSRVVAAGVDGLLVAPWLLALFIANEKTKTAFPLYALGGLLAVTLFYQFGLTVETGQSVGKRALGIEIVRTDRSVLHMHVLFVRMWLPLLTSGAPFIAMAAYFVFGGFLSAGAPGTDEWLSDRPILTWSIWYCLGAELVSSATLLLPDARTWYDRLAGTEVVVLRGPRKPVNNRQILSVSITLAVLLVVGAFVIGVVGVLFFAANIYFRWVGPRAR